LKANIFNFWITQKHSESCTSFLANIFHTNISKLLFYLISWEFVDYVCTFWVEMGPDLNRSYFWPAVNKRLTHLWLGYFLTPTQSNFFIREKMGKFGIFRGNFQNPNQRWLTQPRSKLTLILRQYGINGCQVRSLARCQDHKVTHI